MGRWCVRLADRINWLVSRHGALTAVTPVCPRSTPGSPTSGTGLLPIPECISPTYRETQSLLSLTLALGGETHSGINVLETIPSGLFYFRL